MVKPFPTIRTRFLLELFSARMDQKCPDASSGSHASLAGWTERPTHRPIEVLRQVIGKQCESVRILGVSRVTIWSLTKRLDFGETTVTAGT